MMITASGSHTLADSPNSFWKIPKVPGPHTSCVISLSTLVHTLSPGRTERAAEEVEEEASESMWLERIFSVMVMARLTCFFGKREGGGRKREIKKEEVKRRSKKERKKIESESFSANVLSLSLSLSFSSPVSSHFSFFLPVQSRRESGQLAPPTGPPWQPRWRRRRRRRSEERGRRLRKRFGFSFFFSTFSTFVVVVRVDA